MVGLVWFGLAARRGEARRARNTPKTNMIFHLAPPQFPTPPLSYIELEWVSYFLKQVDNTNAFNAVLTWFKLFKFMRENKKMSQLVDTLEVAGGDMLVVCVIIVIVASGYSIAFHLAFGHAVSSYRDFPEALFTLFLATLGEFDVDDLRNNNTALGPVLFVTFIVVVFFIILSMFLAIVDKAYEVVRLQLEDVVDDVDPLTRDVLRVVNIPLNIINKIYFIFTGKGAEIEPTQVVAEVVEEKKSVKEKKTDTPDHKFKALYDDAMGRIDLLKKNQIELQAMLGRIQNSFLPAVSAAPEVAGEEEEK